MIVHDTPVGDCEIKFSQNKGTGLTVATIKGKDAVVWKGEARCSLRESRGFGSGFVPLKGKKIALARAMVSAGWTKLNRVYVWQELDARGWLRGNRQFREE